MKIKPKLRFPEFDGEWEEKQLSAILEIGTGKSKVQSNESGKYNILGSTGIIGKSHTYDYEGDFILTARVGHYAGKLYKHAGKVNISDNTIYLFNFINKNFIYESLNAFKLEKLVFGSGQPLIKASDLKKLKIRVPVSKEQKKIGGFFSKLDRQIELEEQKLEKLEEQKKSYMQKIFSQELRFQDENGADYPNWKKKTIKEVANLTAGKSKKNENKGKYIIMDMGTVTKNGTMLTHKSTRYESDLLNKGDLVMPKDDIGGGHIIGKTVFIPESHKYVLGDHVYRLEIKKCNSLFLHFFINSDIVNHSLKRKVTGSAQLGLNRKSVEEEVIKTPCLEEQGKIGNLFNKIDNLIELQIDKIELLKQRKQGLLQKMFV